MFLDDYVDTYLMESEEETKRLDLKTDPDAVELHGRWAGIRPGMRVADLGCGSGKTTACLNRMTQPGGGAVGVDISEQRITFARERYGKEGIEFLQRDIRSPLEDLGLFDLLWIRFVLEYHRSASFEIIQNVSRIVKPGGSICLIDLDYNCLSHYGLPSRLERSIVGVMSALEEKADFDPYMGKKLYSYLYDLGYEDIRVDMRPHHLIYGELEHADRFNWTKKVEVAVKNSGYVFQEYPEGYEGFFAEFKWAFEDPRRFTYTPVIACLGRKPPA